MNDAHWHLTIRRYAGTGPPEAIAIEDMPLPPRVRARSWSVSKRWAFALGMVDTGRE